MADLKQTSQMDTPENFGIEDCEALLEFPYHDYTNNEKQVVHFGAETPYGSPESFQTNNTTTSSRNSEVHSELSGEKPNEEECLKLNLYLQKQVNTILAKANVMLEKNLAKQEELIEVAKDIEKSADGKVRYAKPISLFASPYFRDVRGMIPPDNPDTIEKQRRKDVTAYLLPPRPWTRGEKNRLIQGVAANALSTVLKPLKNKRDHLKAKLKDTNILEFEMEIIKKQLLRIEKKIRNESSRPLSELLEQTKGSLDWMTISATNLQGSKTYEECEIMWNNYLSNSVNKGHFTPAEDKKLKELVRKHGGKSWDQVAKELNTKRTGIQCLERYQTHINEDLTNKYWTPEEDRKLIEIIDAVKIKNFIPWNKVCCYMEGRTRHQILNRYERTISKEITRGPFTTKEDAMIIACAAKLGLRWTKMKEFLPGRSTYYIRERYVNTLDPSLKIGNWNRNEDLKLIALIKKYGYGKWAQISREMPGRTDNMCLVRAQRLEHHTKRIYKKKGKVVDPDGSLVLMPDAPSKICRVQNARLRSIQNAALYKLKGALETIQPHIEEGIDFEDLSTLSMNTLRAVQKVLNNEVIKSEPHAEAWTPHYVPPKFQRKEVKGKKPLKDVEEYISSEGEDPEDRAAEEDDEIVFKGEGDEVVLDMTEKQWVQAVLRQRLEEEANLISSNMKLTSISLNRKEASECAFYGSYLKKKMLCKEVPEVEDYSSEEYRNTLADVIRYFIEPELSEDQPIVLCPNFGTMTAMEIMEFTKTRLRRTAGYIQNSKSYLRYLLGQKEEKPKCTKCKGNPSANSELLAAVLESMQNRLLIVDDSMSKAAESEIGLPSQECCCEELQNSRNAFNLLQRRFLSIFLWPSLLASNDVSETQGKILGEASVTKYEPKEPGKCRKRGRPPFKIKKEPENPPKKICLQTEDSEPVPSTSAINDVKVKNPPKKRKRLQQPPTPMDTSNLRRSSRTCVTTRTSFSFIDTADSS